MRIPRKLVIAGVMTAAICGVAYGQGEQLQPFADLSIGSGARAWGMGGAFVAIADDATAASWNPSGLAIIRKPEFTISYVPYAKTSTGFPGMRGVFDTTFFQEFVDQGGRQFSGGSDYLDYLAFAYPFSIGKRTLAVQLSYQRAINFDFTTSTDYPRTESNFRVGLDGQPSVITVIQESTRIVGDGGLDVLALSAATDIVDSVSIGVTINYWNLDVAFDGSGDGRRIRVFDDEDVDVVALTSRSRTEIDFDGLSASIGILWRPMPKLTLGAVFKTSPKLSGGWKRGGFSSASNSPTSGFTLTEHPDSEIEWPKTFGLGLAYRPIERLTVSLDWTRVSWSDSTITTGGNVTPFPFAFANSTSNINLANSNPIFSEGDDVDQQRLGLEYIISTSAVIPLRFGVFRDQMFWADPSGRPVDRLGFTIGAGVTRDRWGIDVALVDISEGDSQLQLREENCCFQVGDFEYASTKVLVSFNYRLE